MALSRMSYFLLYLKATEHEQRFNISHKAVSGVASDRVRMHFVCLFCLTFFSTSKVFSILPSTIEQAHKC